LSTQVKFPCYINLSKERVYLTYIAPPYTIMEEDLKTRLANRMLSQYMDEASLVITTRLHCALPCVAMGIPVILFGDPNDPRLSVAEWAGLKVNPVAQFSKVILQLGESSNHYLKSIQRRLCFLSLDWHPLPLDFEGKKHEIIAHLNRSIKDVINAITNSLSLTH